MMSARARPGREDSRPPVVQAKLEYLGAMTERPRFHMGDPARDCNALERVTVSIRDARPQQRDFSLDESGFALFSHPTSLENVRDAKEVQRVYRPELERALLEITGAARVMITPNGVVRLARRSADFGAPHTTYTADHVHSDYTRASGPAMLESLLGPDEAKTWLTKRFAIYSLWRAFSPPPQDVPIALCDARSVQQVDAVLTDVVIGPPGKELVFEGSSFHYNPRHEWYYFRDMHRDELLIIKAYDSDEKRAWRVPHTGFTDPSAPPDAPPRVSMDIRAIALFDS